MDWINRYLAKRELTVAAARIERTALLLLAKANELGNKRLTRADEYQSDELIHFCQQSQSNAAHYFDERADLTADEEEALTRLKDLEIQKLFDCKLCSELMVRLARGFRARTGSILCAPLIAGQLEVTLLEAAGLLTLFMAVMGGVNGLG